LSFWKINETLLIMIRIVVTVFFLLSGNIAFATDYMQNVATSVLQKLYDAHGDKSASLPKIRMTDDEENGAFYLPRSRTIELSRKTYQICQGFGADSLAALAFILGHELAHAYQAQSPAATSNCLARTHGGEDGEETEEAADVQGLFIAYLAGFPGSKDILPDLFSRIYKTLNLSDTLQGYPSLSERQKTLQKVRAKADELIRLYEAGVHLMAIGRYELAAACFEHINTGYSGREIHNNLALCYALRATVDSPYAYPLEISWSTRMQKVRSKETQPLAPDEKKALLAKAEAHLAAAAHQDNALLTTDINLMCVMILGGRPKDALAYATTRRLLQRADKQTDRQKLHLAFALAHAHNGEGEKALELWKAHGAAGGMAAAQAEFNQKVWNGESPWPDGDPVCPEIPGTDRVVDGVWLQRLDLSGLPVDLLPDKRIKVFLQEKPTSLVYRFEEDGAFLSLQRISMPRPVLLSSPPLERLFTDAGSIAHCQTAGMSIRMDSEGKVLEWCKYLPNQ
jgi:hypothetical protein